MSMSKEFELSFQDPWFLTIYRNSSKNLKLILLMGYAAGTGFEIQERFVRIVDNENRGLDDSLSLVISQLVPPFLNDKKVNKC